MRSSLLDYAFSVPAFYKTAAGLRVKHCTPQLQQYKVMLSFAFKVRMSEKLHMNMDIYMHVLLEYT